MIELANNEEPNRINKVVGVGWSVHGTEGVRSQPHLQQFHGGQIPGIGLKEIS